MGRLVKRGARSSAVIFMVILVAVAAGLAVRVFWRSAADTTTASCSTGPYSLDTGQAATASTMVGVVLTRGLPERAAVLVLAAGLQESKLRNLASGDGDRDSVGVLQQRPSQGWGTIAQLNDLHYATGKFLDALVKVSNWQTLSLAVAIQDVQISADGDAYAKHEGQAQALSDALTGSTPAGLSCKFPTPKIVATTEQVTTSVTADLPVNPPSTAGSTVTVPGAGWATAAWFVANADRLGITTVGFSERTWTRTKGWRTDASAVTTAVTATMHS
jgi:hypothetical protein